MNDRQFWDSYLSSMEDLREDPPPEVKRQVFQRMARMRRRKRLMQGGAYGLLALLFLGGSTFFLLPAEEQDETAYTDEDAVHVWDRHIPGLNAGPGTSREKVPPEEGKKERADKLVAQTVSANEGEASEKDLDKRGGRTASGEARERKKGRRSVKKADMKKPEGSTPDENKTKKRGEQKKPAGTVKKKNPGGAENLDESSLEPMPDRIPKADGYEAEGTIGMKEKELPVPDIDISQRRFFVGADMAFNFTRLMDRKTMESFKASSLVATEGDVFMDVALSGGVNLSERTRVLGRYFMKKDIGQQYYQYVEGRFREQGIQLTYRNYELLLEHDLLQGNIDPEHQSYLSVFGGGHVASLRQAQRKGEGRMVDVSGQYRDRTFGVKGGFRLGMECPSGFDVGLLLGSSYSLSDIGGQENPRSLTEGKTRNLSLGAGLSVRYNFGPPLGATHP
ncbi:MAG: hypothetical protein ABEH38_03140 [Flavobacteriales bacterium]